MKVTDPYDISRRTLLRAAGLTAAAPTLALAAPLGAAAGPSPRTTAAATAATAYDPDLGGATELFIDAHRVESAVNVSREVHPGTKMVNPHTGHRVMVPYGENPWEPTRNQLYGSVIFDTDEQIFKMWYRTLLPNGQPRICYATSEDGYRWEKPDIGVVTFEGSFKNNISLNMDIASVLKDPRDEDPSRRYKLFGHGSGGYNVVFSADGLRWHSRQVVMPDGDTCSANYDPVTGRFIATMRHPHPRVRVAYLSTSTDFVTWSPWELISTGDERGDLLAKSEPWVTDVAKADEQIYAHPVIPYEGAYIGLPWIFQYTGGNGPGGNADGHVRPQLAFSRDLVNWVRDDRTFLIDSGPAGSFDSGIIQGTTNDFVIKDDKVWLYYAGFNTSHGGPLAQKRVAIGLVTWRLDGFASMANGGDEPGVLTTRPVLVGGNQLHVNADLTSQVRSGGQLRVEVLDAAGAAIPGYGVDDAVLIRGDRIDSCVRWRGGTDLAALRGREVKLRFHLAGGDLYSYYFSGSVRAKR